MQPKKTFKKKLLSMSKNQHNPSKLKDSFTLQIYKWLPPYSQLITIRLCHVKLIFCLAVEHF